MIIDMQIKDFIAHTRTAQKFRSIEQSRDTDSYCYFRLPIEAAVTSFKLETGDNYAIEDETRPSKQARKLYNKAMRSKTPAAILKEVELGIYQANLGRIPPDVQVTIVVKYAERIASNARGRSFDLSSLITSAERLGQMYSVCNQWISKVAADSISESDDDVDFNGPRPYDDQLSRLTLPTHLFPPEKPAVNWTPQASQKPSEPKVKPRYYGGCLAEDLSHVEVNPCASAEPSYPAMDQKPSREANTTDAPPNRHNEYFVPRDGIDREVITADITRYLGNDALVRPRTYENKKDGRAMQGYFITAYRDLTSAMIADLKADSARWEQERRNYNSRTQYYADAFFAAQRKESFGPSQQAPGSQDSHEAQRIWPQIAASLSADGTYALSADLRNRVAANFTHGTREWLAARIAAIFPVEGNSLASEAAAETMLVLAFVKICIPSRYEEVEQGVGLILNSQEDQRKISEDLVLRVRERGRDYRLRRR
ncbi:hypothetical protein INS49_013332 [Diaporthe citri]|uniref:uncharacterized protein n=1 Tax=Diaporthe citri TaxID=83186 RepID=UPI001C806D52|nr:uncharacterized protein INS49_013332 [Diaporthe citri]KAG6357455.1 hypothetical protein INS49_013332 [Diaporthe citri]